MFKTKQDYVYEQLYEAILSGRFKPGEHLVLEELGEELGTSRTPLREAIRRLQTEGLVDSTPHRGAVVADLSVEELIELYHIRAVLEGLAARLATENLSDEELTQLQDIFDETRRELDPSNPVRFEEFNRPFHEIIYQGANAPFLYEMIINLYTKTGLYRHLSLRSTGRVQDVLDEHHRILDALLARDAELAERCAREHHECTAKALVDLLEKGFEGKSAEEQQISLVEKVAD
jgi:DNA-binding GntR family transcriptional regulator